MAVSTAKTKKKTKAVKSAKKTGAKTKSSKPKTTKATVKKTLKGAKGTSKTKKVVSSVSAKTKTDKSMAVSNGKAYSKTYLNDKDLKFFRELVIEQKDEILENARKLRESIVDENTGDYVGDNSTFSMHMAEQGSDEMEREKAFMLVQRDEKHLFYLENALERIAKKTYGLCITCGKPINKARLEAVPITSHCINCKQSLSS